MAFWGRTKTHRLHEPPAPFDRGNGATGGSFRAPAPAAEKPPEKPPAARRAFWSTTRPTRIKTRSRQSVDNPTLGYLQGLTIIAPFSAEEKWRALQLDQATLDTIGTADLLELLSEVSPEVSNAFWQLLRMCNPGYKLKIMTADKKAVHVAGQAFCEGIIAQFDRLYGSFNVILNRLYANAFLRGAFAAELVFDGDGQVVDLAVPDARWIYFQIQLDPVRGPIWQPFQWVKGEKVLLDRPTIRYVPVDPLPGSPVGRALCTPAVFSCLFLVGLLHDLRRVIAQQGYPRLDIGVELEKLLLTMPPDVRDDPAKTQEWVDEAVRNIGDMYSSLEPDDAYVHTDNIAMNRPVGTVDSSSLGAVDGLIQAIERFMIRGLKSMPLLMGTNEASSETHANRQWEVYVAGIRSLQLLAEGMLDYFFNLILQAAGIPALCEFRFEELRKSELLRDAQVKKLTITNAAIAYDRGWISQEQAAKEGFGVDQPDEAEPRIPGAGVGPGTQGSGGGDGGAASGAPDGTQKDTPLTVLDLLGPPLKNGRTVSVE